VRGTSYSTFDDMRTYAAVWRLHRAAVGRRVGTGIGPRTPRWPTRSAWPPASPTSWGHREDYRDGADLCGRGLQAVRQRSWPNGSGWPAATPKLVGPRGASRPSGHATVLRGLRLMPMLTGEERRATGPWPGSTSGCWRTSPPPRSRCCSARVSLAPGRRPWSRSGQWLAEGRPRTHGPRDCGTRA